MRLMTSVLSGSCEWMRLVEGVGRTASLFFTNLLRLWLAAVYFGISSRIRFVIAKLKAGLLHELEPQSSDEEEDAEYDLGPDGEAMYEATRYTFDLRLSSPPPPLPSPPFPSPSPQASPAWPPSSMDVPAIPPQAHCRRGGVQGASP
jgi:hypothetical protein